MTIMKYSLVLLTAISLFACSAEVSTTGDDADVETAAPTSSALSWDEFFAKAGEEGDAFVGQEVTIKAYCWGTSSTVSGDKFLDVGKKPMEGFVQITFQCSFADGTDIDGIEKDSEVTIKGTVAEANSFGERAQLTNCSLVQ